MKYLLFKFESRTASKSCDSRIHSATTLLQDTDTDADTAIDTRTDTRTCCCCATIFFIHFYSSHDLVAVINLILSFFGILFRFVLSSHLSRALLRVCGLVSGPR